MKNFLIDHPLSLRLQYQGVQHIERPVHSGHQIVRGGLNGKTYTSKMLGIFSTLHQITPLRLVQTTCFIDMLLYLRGGISSG